MNLFAHFQRLIVGEIEALARAGELPAGLDVAARRGRAAARSGAWRSLDQCRDGAGESGAAWRPRRSPSCSRRGSSACPTCSAVEIAGPGFLNLRLADSFWHVRLAELLRAGRSYGDSTLGQGRKVNVEYVSANPTGPLHVGHGRDAVVGDALAALLAKAGFAVCREYYINDAGAQVDTLARSLHLRYREALGESDRRDPRGPLSRRLSEGHRAGARGARRQEMARRAEEEWLPRCANSRSRK